MGPDRSIERSSSDICGGRNLNYHDYFVFDLSGIAPGTPLLGASLSIGNPSTPSPGYISPNPTLTYNNYDVTTPIAALEAAQSAAVGIYNDVGSGIFYASTIVSAADNGTQVAITLDPKALEALTAAEGSQFAIGGAISAVPEPGFFGLVGAGLALCIFQIRRVRVGNQAAALPHALRSRTVQGVQGSD